MIEELLHMSPVPGPYVDRSGILVPHLLKALKFSLSSFEAWRSVDPLELGGVCLVIPRGDVLDGIADQVNDAALYDDILEDGSFFAFCAENGILLSRSKINNDPRHVGAQPTRLTGALNRP